MIAVPTYIPWLLGLSAVLLLLWLAWRRPNKKRLVWRVLASVLAGISLVLMVFPPSFQKQVDPGTAILLTDGYEPDSLAALLLKFEAAPVVYSYQTTAADAVPVSNLYALLQQQPQLQTIHLFGNGLSLQELEALKSRNVVSHISEHPDGIIAVSWPTSGKAGEAVAVSGHYKVPVKEAVSLYLLAAGAVRDSIQFKEPGNHPFQLAFTPKQEGRYVYQLLAKTANGTDTLGHVPVQVLPSEKLGILILSAAPLFEFKFLKNHLGDLQHRVALRSTVSKGISQNEWVNMPQTNLSRITPALLKQFDLVVTEPQALQDMSQAERAILERAVTENGLGVLTIRGEQLPGRTTAFFTGFAVKRVSQQETRTTTATWADNTQAAASVVPYTLNNDNALIRLVDEKENGMLAAARKKGWGTVAISLIPQTFSWQLEGKQKIYASYWAYLLSEIAKKKEQDRFWQLTSPQAPKKNEPITLTYTDYTTSKALNVPQASVRALPDTTGITLSLEQNQHRPEQFRTTFWPQETGWHVLKTPETPAFYFFVQDTADWQHETLQTKRNATLAFAAQQQATISTAQAVTSKEQVPVFWFFILFVLSSGFLWLEEKL